MPRGVPVLRAARGALTLGETTLRFEGFDLPGDGETGLLSAPLFDALMALYDARRVAHLEEPRAAGRLVLSLAPDVPYRLLTQIVYTAGQSRFDGLSALVKTSEGARVIALDVPHIMAAKPGELDALGHGTPCSSAESMVSTAGVRVRARQAAAGDGPTLLTVPVATERVFAGEGEGELAALLGDLPAGGLGLGDGGGTSGVGLGSAGSADAAKPTGAGSSAVGRDRRRTPRANVMRSKPKPKLKPKPKPRPEPTAPTADWRGALMIPAAGVCPSVPRRDGRVDRAALTSLLEAVYAIEPGCRRATVGADPALPWQDVADVLQVHRALDHLPMLVVSEPDPPGCAGAQIPPRPTAP